MFLGPMHYEIHIDFEIDKFMLKAYTSIKYRNGMPQVTTIK